MQKAPSNEFTYIELDDKMPWWTSVVALIAVIAIVAVLVAPWVVNLDNEENSVAASVQSQSSSYCRPEANDLPRFLNPTMASWNRFCEWFVEPNIENNAP